MLVISGPLSEQRAREERLTQSNYKRQKIVTTPGEAHRKSARGLFSGGFFFLVFQFSEDNLMSYFGIGATVVICSQREAGVRIAEGF